MCVGRRWCTFHRYRGGMGTARRNRRNSHHYERGGISFVRTGTGTSYRVRFPADPWALGWGTGHASVVRRFNRLADAERWYHREIDAQDDAHARGDTWLTEAQRIRDRRSRRLTFRQYAARYLAGYRTANGYGRRPTAATMANKRNAVGHLVAYFGDRPLRSITPADVASCFDAMAAHGRSQAHADAVELKTMLHRASMRDARGRALIPYDPAADVPTPPVPRSSQALKAAITATEERALYEWFRANRPAEAAAVPLACNIDLRPQDYLALKVGDIHPRELTLSVTRSQTREPGRGLTTKAPKTAASAQDRHVPRELMRILEDHIAANTDGRPGSWLFHAPDGRGMLSRNTFANHFRKAAAAIGRPDLSPYVMRATADDRIARHASGMNAKEMLAMQGRSDEGTSIRHYQKLDARNMQRHAECSPQ